ncbi:tetratricopeptide repeat protein [Nostoc sp. CHAB 5834]|nr:tetratricopeptide repeat protein [Nostoc sp. CHAB 5834]
MALYEQSLEIFEQIGDVQGKAVTLQQLAGIYANQGEVEQALAIYQHSVGLQRQSLPKFGRINRV